MLTHILDPNVKEEEDQLGEPPKNFFLGLCP